MAFHNALETFTLRDTGNVDPLEFPLGEGFERDLVTELELHREVVLELDELALGSGPCLFKVPFQGLAGVIF